MFFVSLPAVEDGLEVIGLVVVRQVSQHVHRARAHPGGAVGHGCIVVAVRGEDADGPGVVAVAKGLEPAAVDGVRDGRVDGVADHALPVEMEVETDDAKARVEVVPQVPVVVPVPQPMLAPVWVGLGRKGQIIGLLAR